jgi:O-antigen/teichoic acid export membrane protein
MSLKNWISKKRNSATLMTWLSTAVSIGSSLIVLPLALLYLNEAELALWLTYSLLLTFGMMADFGFAPSAVRAAAAYISGAASLPNYGEAAILPISSDGLRKSNFEGLNMLENTLIWVYRRLLIVALAFTGLGVIWVYPERASALNDHITAEWSVLLLIVGMALSLYAQLWGALRQMLGNVAGVRQTEVVLGLIRILFTALALIFGGGLLGVLFVMVAMSMLSLFVARRYYNKERIKFGIKARLFSGFDAEVFEKVWPATWRQGVIIVGGFIINQSGGLIVAKLPDAGEASRYLLTLRIFGVLRQFAQAPIYAHIPYFSKLMVEGRIAEIKSGFSKRMSFTFGILFGGLVSVFILFDILLPHLQYKNFLVNPGIYFLMALSLIFEAHHGAHSNLYLARNHVPFLFPSVISGSVIVCLSFVLVNTYGVLGVVVAQMMVQLTWNNWYPVKLNLNLLNWPLRDYARSLLHAFF